MDIKKSSAINGINKKSMDETSMEPKPEPNETQSSPDNAESIKRGLHNEHEKQTEFDNPSTSKRRRSDENTDLASTRIPLIKEEPADDVATSAVDTSCHIAPSGFKTEPLEETDDSPESETGNGASSSTQPNVCIKKEEGKDDAVPKMTAVCSSTQAIVADSSVSSSTLRPSCRFGIKCYRRNPAHRDVEAHPGDSDYRRPNFPTPPLGTPDCPFGNSCYRRNPVHFQQYLHPSDFNSAQNIRNRLRQRRAQAQSNNGQPNDDFDLESDEEEDPFHDQGDSDLDYKPGVDIDDDDEEDELEFNSERQNCDDYD